MEWWQYLDWSRMEGTFERLSEQDKQKIMSKGYWSLGKGKFENRNV
jgi:hypothetical protein